MTENDTEKKEKRPKKAAAPVKFYGLAEADVNQVSGEGEERNVDVVRKVFEFEADKKSELFRQLEELTNPKVLILIRGRKINLQQKLSYKI